MSPRTKPKRITVTQLAHRLHLSPATVSFVLNGKAEQFRIPAATAERVREEAARMNYRPSAAARQLAGKRGNVVGVLVNTEAVADPRLIQCMEMMAAARGIRFIVGHAVGTHEQVMEYLADFRARGVDAVISIFHDHPDYHNLVMDELALFDRVIYYERPQHVKHGQQVCYVQPDFYEVGRLGVQHMIDRGRNRIALVLNDLVFAYAQTRSRAHADALRAVGREPNSELVWVMDNQPGMSWTQPFTPDRALAVVEELVVKQRADAIVAVNDVYAARIVAALRRCGRRVPDDVAVIGCDDLELGTMIEPALTTIDLQVEGLSRAAVGLLFEMLDHGTVPEERCGVQIQPTLIVREST